MQDWSDIWALLPSASEDSLIMTNIYKYLSMNIGEKAFRRW